MIFSAARKREFSMVFPLLAGAAALVFPFPVIRAKKPPFAGASWAAGCEAATAGCEEAAGFGAASWAAGFGGAACATAGAGVFCIAANKMSSSRSSIAKSYIEYGVSINPMVPELAENVTFWEVKVYKSA
jgi:hypothetical protein